MPISLADRVRGEQVPLNGVHLRLLEVIIDDERTPLWRARCLQTGKLLTVALDGLVQVPVSSPIRLPDGDHEELYRRRRRRQRWKFFFWSLLIAGLAFIFRDHLAGWLGSLRELVQGGVLPGFTPPS